MEYEYIIVGAGSAGCVLANRLTADAEQTVLLLEAGSPDEKREITIPAAFAELFQTSIDWEYYTEPQPQLNDRRLYWPRGKTLGGSSALNAMVCIRGHPSDYNHWRSLGNDGWGWEDVLPYFKRLEHNERSTSPYHGQGGPLHITDPPDPNPLSEVFVEAATEVGFSRNDDFNAGKQAGVGQYQVSVKDGERHSTADAYLKPVLDRPTLDVRTRAHVTQIRFDGMQAIGVEYDQDGETIQVDATEEVIVASGAINSPQLLMLSGIGPADHLREHGVTVVQDLPGVGRNLQDHLTAGVVYKCTKPVSLDGADNLWNVLKYLLFKTGPLTSNVAEAGGFGRTVPGLEVPDLQLHFAPAYFIRHGFENPSDGHGFSIGVTKLRPASRGRITLQSTDPMSAPAIDPQYLSHDEDLTVLLDGIKIARDIAHADAFDTYRGVEVLPGSEAKSDAALIAQIQEYAQTLYHPVGTCKMGDDAMAVVDDNLQVHGVNGLRVVDASIMPTIVGGNTNVPTIMIAEKAADLIT